MRIAVHSSSEAVTRALTVLVEAVGHEIVPADDAQLLLVDTIHPAKAPADSLPRLLIGGSELPSPLRVATLLQAIQQAASPMVPLRGDWLFDPTARALTHPDHNSVTLTEKEAVLMQALLAAPAQGLTRDVLLADIWGIKNEADTHTFETHLYRLRAKLNGLNPVPAELVNENGFYRAVVA